ncbi:MAG TPA: exosortase E/protease, VPEID-CTERM system [Steroidobacteraceae bacterium]|nr:exosortase E/protease, VPEID-CTERM system [Steroidobacteraceae bacterium]
MGTTASRALPQLNARLNLAVRGAAVVAVLFAEKALLNLFVDFQAAQTAQGFGALVRIGQHWGFRFAVTLAAALALFCYVRDDSGLREINAEARGAPLRIRQLLAHFVLVLPLAPLSFLLYRRASPLPFPAIVALWLAFAFAALIALLLAAAPWDLWRRAARATGVLWIYAGAAAVAAASAMEWSQQLWGPTAGVTFALVRDVLAPFIPSLQADPAARVLSTNRFAIEVAPICSGLEGMGLMFAFCCAWLLYFRKEYIFPRALILVPAGLLLIFGLNVLRIATLMAIGYAGYPSVAVYGFHSQAGWIAFNVAAGGIAYSTRRSRWLNRSARTESHSASADNPTAAYLIPFLAILATGMLARAISSGFETLYILRFIAAAIALRVYCARIKALDWRFSWRAPLLGIAVFGVWIVGAHFALDSHSMPAALAAMSPATRALWIGGRILASVSTVPVAEELAYRGYLMRRVLAADFESVPFMTVGLVPVLVSAAVFGITEGSLWLPGFIAGVMFAVILIRTGRFGEAVAAHATTNGLIAAWVLLANQWQLW